MKNIIHNIIHPTTRRTSNRLPMPENVRKGFRRYSCAVLTGAMILGLTMPAYAANDPLTVVNNLSTFIFGLIRAVGLILLGWGIVQVGLSFLGLSMRQCGFSLAAMLVAVGLYFLLKPYVGTETVSWMCILGAAPIAAMGFVNYHGMTAEQLAWAWIRSELLEPKWLISEPDDLYYKLLEDTISNHEKEGRLQ